MTRMLAFNSKAISEHSEVPLADDGEFERLVEHWTSRQAASTAGAERKTACYVASVGSEREQQVRTAQLT
jgi:hypothetical protein